LALLLGINLMLSFTSSRIAWEAHIGGLLAGIVIAYAWDRLRSGGSSVTMQRTVIALAVAAVALGTLILA
jgi:membrane associated rhomboid family serine protease